MISWNLLLATQRSSAPPQKTLYLLNKPGQEKPLTLLTISFKLLQKEFVQRHIKYSIFNGYFTVNLIFFPFHYTQKCRTRIEGWEKNHWC